MIQDEFDIKDVLNGLVEMIIWQWWENSDQTGELVQTTNIQQLTNSKLVSLIDKVGVTMATVT